MGYIGYKKSTRLAVSMSRVGEPGGGGGGGGSPTLLILTASLVVSHVDC